MFVFLTVLIKWFYCVWSDFDFQEKRYINYIYYYYYYSPALDARLPPLEHYFGGPGFCRLFLMSCSFTFELHPPGLGSFEREISGLSLTSFHNYNLVEASLITLTSQNVPLWWSFAVKRVFWWVRVRFYLCSLGGGGQGIMSLSLLSLQIRATPPLLGNHLIPFTWFIPSISSPAAHSLISASVYIYCTSLHFPLFSARLCLVRSTEISHILHFCFSPWPACFHPDGLFYGPWSPPACLVSGLFTWVTDAPVWIPCQPLVGSVCLCDCELSSQFHPVSCLWFWVQTCQ